RPGDDGDASLLGEGARRHLVPEGRDGVRRRADEGDAERLTASGELGVLREEAVARVDGVYPSAGGDLEDGVYIEVGRERLALLADEPRLVRFVAVEGEAVLPRVDGDGGELELGRRAEDANGDLASIGDENFSERTTHSAAVPRPAP